MNRSDRGSASVELALIVPAVVLVLGTMILGSRLYLARGAVHQAAGAAARAASLSRSAGEAQVAAQRVLDASLASDHVACVDRNVVIDTSGFRIPVGQPASVTVHVSCLVPLADLAIPGLPGSLRAEATVSSALDTYRERR